jgi:hypothetical protein
VLDNNASGHGKQIGKEYLGNAPGEVDACASTSSLLEVLAQAMKDVRPEI